MAAGYAQNYALALSHNFTIANVGGGRLLSVWVILFLPRLQSKYF